jgi:hypothetical protein
MMTVGIECVTRFGQIQNIFRDIIMCSSVTVNRIFGEIYRLRFHYRKVKKPAERACCLFYAGFFFGPLFDSENEGDLFF